MGRLFLIILGIVLCSHGFAGLGFTSIFFALAFNGIGEKLWSIFLGVILMLTPGWFAVGVLSLIVGLVLPSPSAARRRFV